MFWDNLKQACEMRGMKVTPLLTELKISTGNIGKWQSGGDISSKNLLKISNRLDVSVDFLLKGSDAHVQEQSDVKFESRSEEDLIMMYRCLSPYQKDKCYTYVQGMYDSIELSKKSQA